MSNETTLLEFYSEMGRTPSSLTITLHDEIPPREMLEVFKDFFAIADRVGFINAYADLLNTTSATINRDTETDPVYKYALIFYPEANDVELAINPDPATDDREIRELNEWTADAASNVSASTDS